MSTNIEDTFAFKAFLFCPVPGLDIAVGATVLAATEIAKASAEAVKEAISDGIKEGIVSGIADAVTLAETAAQRQLAPLVSSLDSAIAMCESFSKQNISEPKQT